jgi:holo-[acyl-carrier protein] synthase
MTIGLGVDIVDAGRFCSWVGKPSLVGRYFAPREAGTALGKGLEAAPSLAVRFAAKEAFGKALGTGLRGLRLLDIEVVQDGRGKPSLLLRGTALEAFKAAGGEICHLSLSHDGNHAVAVVLIEG